MTLTAPASPLTSPFLNAFQPRPVRGGLQFPGGELARATAPQFQSVVRRLIGEVERLADMGESQVTSEWEISEFANMGMAQYVNLRRPDARFIFLYDSGKKIEAAVGVQTPHIAYLLSNECDFEADRVSTSYHFGFFSEGLGRLRAALRMGDAPLSELAWAVGSEIGSSGQYDQNVIKRCTRIFHSTSSHAPEESLDALRSDAARSWTKIGLSFGSEEPELPGALIPEALDPGKEYLDVCLKDDDRKAARELMPLHPRLQGYLWDLVELMATSPLMVFDRN